jgi:hypothetical protein
MPLLVATLMVIVLTGNFVFTAVTLFPPAGGDAVTLTTTFLLIVLILKWPRQSPQQGQCPF